MREVKGTPAAVVAKLNASVVDSLADPQVAARLGEMAQDISACNEQTPQALGMLQRAEMDKWLRPWFGRTIKARSGCRVILPTISTTRSIHGTVHQFLRAPPRSPNSWTR